MKQSRFAFIIACCILYTFRSEVLNPFATEVLLSGSQCPSNINGLSNFTLSELDGLYYAAAFYSENNLNMDLCYKILFEQVNEAQTNVRVDFKRKVLGIPVPVVVNVRLHAESDNGTFSIRDSLTSRLNLGQAYILSNDSLIIYYSCRPSQGLLFGNHASEVLVLSKNETPTWSTEDEAAVKQKLKEYKLDYGYLRPVYQGRESCD